MFEVLEMSDENVARAVERIMVTSLRSELVWLEEWLGMAKVGPRNGRVKLMND